MTTKAIVPALLILVLGALVFVACGTPTPEFRGSAMDDPQPAPDFQLTDQHGQPFRLSDQRGKVVLLFFGYTRCPDVCPTTLATWKRVHSLLGEDAARVRFVFVTVDPERDTPERLADHVGAFNPDFIGLTGSLAELEPIYRAYGIHREVDTTSGSAAGYLVNHTASAFVIDPDGVWRLRHTFGTHADDIAHDVRQLLP